MDQRDDGSIESWRRRCDEVVEFLEKVKNRLVEKEKGEDEGGAK
jgi:hypothetical protein